MGRTAHQWGATLTHAEGRVICVTHQQILSNGSGTMGRGLNANEEDVGEGERGALPNGE